MTKSKDTLYSSVEPVLNGQSLLRVTHMSGLWQVQAFLLKLSLSSCGRSHAGLRAVFCACMPGFCSASKNFRHILNSYLTKKGMRQCWLKHYNFKDVKCARNCANETVKKETGDWSQKKRKKSNRLDNFLIYSI